MSTCARSLVKEYHFALLLLLVALVALLNPARIINPPVPLFLTLSILINFSLGASLKIKDTFLTLKYQSKALILFAVLHILGLPLASLFLKYFYPPSEISLSPLFFSPFIPSVFASSAASALSHGRAHLSLALSLFSYLLVFLLYPFLAWFSQGHLSFSLYLPLFYNALLPLFLGFAFTLWFPSIGAHLRRLSPWIYRLSLMILLFLTLLMAKTIFTLSSFLLLILFYWIIFLFTYILSEYLLAFTPAEAKAFAYALNFANFSVPIFTPYSKTVLVTLETTLSALMIVFWQKSYQSWIFINKHLVPRGFSAITLYPLIFLNNKKNINALLINHEAIHLAQQRELLILPFYIIYGLHYTINLLLYRDKFTAYRQIVFEKEAYQNEGNLAYLKKRRFWAFIAYFLPVRKRIGRYR